MNSMLVLLTETNDNPPTLVSSVPRSLSCRWSLDLLQQLVYVALPTFVHWNKEKLGSRQDLLFNKIDHIS